MRPLLLRAEEEEEEGTTLGGLLLAVVAPVWVCLLLLVPVAPTASAAMEAVHLMSATECSLQAGAREEEEEGMKRAVFQLQGAASIEERLALL